MVPGAATARLMHLASLPFDRILPHVPGHLEYKLQLLHRPLVHHKQGSTPKSMDVVDAQAESTSWTTPSPSQAIGHLQEPQSSIQGTPAPTVLYQRSPAHEFQMFQDHLATLRVGGDGIS